MKVRYSRRALSQLASLHEYLLERSPVGERNVVANLRATMHAFETSRVSASAPTSRACMFSSNRNIVIGSSIASMTHTSSCSASSIVRKCSASRSNTHGRTSFPPRNKAQKILDALPPLILLGSYSTLRELADIAGLDLARARLGASLAPPAVQEANP